MAVQGETVAFLGTGAMGAPMAANVVRAGHALRAWNRTRSRAEPPSAEGATVCDTPAGATEGAGIVVTMLADGPAKAKKMPEADLEPMLGLALGRKDAALAAEAAPGAGLDLRLARALVEEMDRAIEGGYGEDDIAAVIAAIRPGSA